MRKVELVPVDSHKSFYGKAVIELNDDGSEVLLSYNTRIIKKNTDGSLTRLWSGWSATTGRHIAAFCGLNKAAFTALPVA